MRRAQGLVAAASIAVAALSVVVYAFYRFRGLSLPMWDKVALTYGLVFCIFLLFDSAAKSVAKARNERRAAEPQRPRLGPPRRPGQAVVPVGGPSLTGRVRLARVQHDWEGFCQRMADCMAEVAALDEQKPPFDEKTGRIVWSDLQDWQGHTARHPFVITVDTQAIGACGAELTASGDVLLIGLYVDPAWRRQGAGSAAMERLAEFLALTGTPTLTIRLSGRNHRGEQFVRKNGFQEAGPGASATEDAPVEKVWVKRLV